MSNKLYVGNLAFSVDDSALESAFSKLGAVESVRVVTDRDTGRSKGFGFVEMATVEGAKLGISSLNGTEIDGRAINVSEARPKTEGGQNSRPQRRW